MKTSLRQYLLLFINKYRIHFIIWFFFILYELIIVKASVGRFSSVGSYALFYGYNITLFYFHAHVIMPFAEIKIKYAIWLLPLFIAIEVVLFILITLYIARFLQDHAGLNLSNRVEFSPQIVATSVWRAVFFLFFSTAYYFLISYLKERKILQEREKERLLMIIENQSVQAELIKSQYAHLKSQINPHFLFNTLSFIYSSTRKVAPDAAETIMTLSDMMRYAIQDDNGESQTDLIMEIEHAENLIKLHRVKSDRKLNLSFEYKHSEIADMQIVPLILITLVENMFKHGDLWQENYPASISINLDNDVLIIETQNLINPSAPHKSHNIGLDNIKKRLQMVYADKAVLHTHKDQNNYFNTVLKIELS